MSKKSDAINNYDGGSIQVLKGLEAVRKRPAMYIGNTNSSGLAHIVFEIFDNSIDEVLADFADTISITFLPDGSVEIEDNGRGIPPESLEVIFTTLHAGGKFNSDVYKSSGGLHGVGTSVTNAMSEWLEVSVYRGGQEHYIRFENGGIPVDRVKVIGKCDKNKSGTKVHFKPDATMFSTVKFNVERIEQRARESAFLNTKVKIEFNDLRSGDPEIDSKKVFDYNGMEDYLAYLSDKTEVIVPAKVFEFVDETTGMEAIIAFQWTESDDTNPESLLSYVNNIRTRDGGTHETGFKTGLTKAFNTFGKDAGLLKGKYNKVFGDDIRDGMIAVISTKIPENILEFESQTKDKLGSIEARSILEAFSYEAFIKFLATNMSDAEYLINRAIKYQKMKEEAKRLKDSTKKSNSKNKKLIASDKLTEPITKDPKRRELFAVEGDSASGSAKMGRFKDFQGVLSLRGKVLNTAETTMEQVLSNAEIQTIIATLKCGVGTSYNEEELAYDKFIIMTDADVDGSHIQILILTFFFRYMRKFIENGHLYIAQPPLYGITLNPKDTKDKQKMLYAWTSNELREKTKDLPKGYHVQRYKGLGEMDAKILRDTTLNPDNRVLLKVTINDFIQNASSVDVFMGSVPEKRKVWMEQNLEFKEDDESTVYRGLDFSLDNLD